MQVSGQLGGARNTGGTISGGAHIPGSSDVPSQTDSLVETIGIPKPVVIGGVRYMSPVAPPWYLLVALMGSVLAFSLLVQARAAFRHAVSVVPRTGKSQQIGVPQDSFPTWRVVAFTTILTFVGGIPFVWSQAGSTNLVAVYLYLPQLLIPIPLIAAVMPLALASYLFTSSWALLRPAATKAGAQARGVSLSGGIITTIGLVADLVTLGFYLTRHR
jgi:hypothetical protein